MRNRMVYADIHLSSSLGEVSMEAELTFILLWRLMDDYGRVEYRADDLIADSYRRRKDVSEGAYASWIDELIAVGCLMAYTDGGKTWLAAPNWGKYQTVNRPSKPKVPEYQKTMHKRIQSVSARVDSSEHSGSGAETRPTVRRCPVENTIFSEHSVSAHSKGRKEGKELTSFPSLRVKGEAPVEKGALPPVQEKTGTLSDFIRDNPAYSEKVPDFLKNAVAL